MKRITISKNNADGIMLYEIKDVPLLETLEDMQEIGIETCISLINAMLPVKVRAAAKVDYQKNGTKIINFRESFITPAERVSTADKVKNILKGMSREEREALLASLK